MSLSFIDTNVLVYAHDPDEGERYDIAQDLLRTLWRERTGVLSTQVLQEFYRVATRKMRPAMAPAEARVIVADYSQWCSTDTDPQLILSATVIDENHPVEWWDALIIEGALRSGAAMLLTEDMHHGQRYGRLTVRNPFAEN